MCTSPGKKEGSASCFDRKKKKKELRCSEKRGKGKKTRARGPGGEKDPL